MTSNAIPTDFWAKISPSSWLSLKNHCIDVAVCAYHLLMQTLLGRRVASLGSIKDLTPSQIAKIAYIAGIHDVGKANKGFQEGVEQASYGHKVTKQGHVKPILALLTSRTSARDRLCHAIHADIVDRWTQDSRTLVLATFQHHGRIYSELDYSYDPSLWKWCVFGDPFDEIRDIADSLLNLFPDANDNSDILPSDPAFLRALNGIITLADWLASDEDFFPHINMPDTERFSHAQKASCDMLKEVGLDTYDFKSYLGTQTLDFERCFCFPPRPFQASITGTPHCPDGSLMILESETGSGKTEAVLYHFLRLFRLNMVDGMYFALPTRTSATQMFERIVQVTKRVFVDDTKRPAVLLAVPGYLRVDEKEGKILPRFTVLWSDDPQDQSRYRGWAVENPKRYMAGTIVVGTIDQALLSVLKVPHSHLRGSALLRLLLVVDEVHASDRYQTTLLKKILKHHMGGGGHMVLMSATLGSWAYEQFIAPDKSRNKAFPISLSDAISRPYPAITVCTRGRRCDLEVPPPSEEKHVEVVMFPKIESPADVAKLTLSLLDKGARILVLRNTVSECIKTQREIEALANDSGLRHALFSCNGVIAPHHSRFAREDRKTLDKEVEARFGKHATSDGPCILCGTQTLEQSLDIDADLLITDLCPMDVLLQRLGRLHRHKRQRPEAFKDPRVVVLVPEGENLSRFIKPESGRTAGPCGIGTVYEDLRVLELTRRELEARKKVVLPQMNRLLVESCLHPERLKKLETENSVWQKHGTTILGEDYVDRRIAELNSFDWSDPFEETRTEDLSKVATRIGDDSIVWHLETPVVSPFGSTITEISVPSWMCKELLNQKFQDLPAKVVSCDSGTCSIEIGGIMFRYSRHGLERENCIGGEDDD